MTVTQLKRRIRFWQKKFLLGDHDITINVGPIPEGHRAGFDANPEYKEGWFWIDPELVPMDNPAKMDRWIVHEFTHYINWPVEQLAENSAGDNEHQFDTVRFICETVSTKWEEVIINVHSKR